jgi:pilus assembly protein Flp/PilA
MSEGISGTAGFPNHRRFNYIFVNQRRGPLYAIDLTCPKPAQNSLCEPPASEWSSMPEGAFQTGANEMFRPLKAFVANESGATAIEYALIASLIAVAIIVSITVLGTQLQNTFNEVSSNLK